MKREVVKMGFWVLIVLAGFSTSVFGKSEGCWLDASTLYLGEVYEDDGVVDYCLFFQNVDTVSVSISELTFQYKNLSAEIEKKNLEPGEKTTIKVHFDPKGTSGIYKDRLFVYSNEKEICSVVAHGIILEGTLNNAVRHKIGEVGLKSSQVNFGFVYKGDVSKRLVPVINQSDHAVVIELDNIPFYIDVLVNPKELAAGETGYFELNYNSNKVGNWDIDRQFIQMTVKGEQTVRENLFVVANIREDFKLLSQDEKVNNPKAKFPENTYEFDTISSGELVEYPFILKNEGARDLVIRAINPACGFADVSPSKATIPPGESAVINTVFDTQGLSGESKRGITIVTNDPVNYKQFLWVKGFIQ